MQAKKCSELLLHTQGLLADQQSQVARAKKFIEDTSRELVQVTHQLQVARQENGEIHEMLQAASSDLERTQAMRTACMDERLLALQERESLHITQIRTLKDQLAANAAEHKDAVESGLQFQRQQHQLKDLYKEFSTENSANLKRAIQLEQDKALLMLEVGGHQARLKTADGALKEAQALCQLLAVLAADAMGAPFELAYEPSLSAFGGY
jgi:hypothetical protein